MAHPRLQRRKAGIVRWDRRPTGLAAGHRRDRDRAVASYCQPQGGRRPAPCRLRRGRPDVPGGRPEGPAPPGGTRCATRPANQDDIRQAVIRWFWSEEHASIERERNQGPPDDFADALAIAERRHRHVRQRQRHQHPSRPVPGHPRPYSGVQQADGRGEWSALAAGRELRPARHRRRHETTRDRLQGDHRGILG